MYAWLSLDATTLELGARWCRASTGTPPALSPADLKRRSDLVASLIKASYPRIDSDESARLRKQVVPMARYFPGPADSLDFAIHMALAHHRLPPAVREAREQAIETLIQAYFGHLTAPPPATLTESLSMLRVMAVLAPDPLQGQYVRSECGQRWRQLLMSFTTADGPPAPEAVGIVQLTRAARLADPEHVDDILPHLCGTYCVLLPGERNILTALVLGLAVSGKGPVIRLAVDAVNALPQQGESAWRLYGLSTLLAKLLKRANSTDVDDMPPADLIAAHMEQMQQQHASTVAQVVGQTAAALRAGVPMGTKGEPCRAVLGALATRLQTVDERMSTARLRGAPRAAGPAPRTDARTDTDAAATDIDPVHAWSVNRLVRWIEGPVVRRPGDAPRNIDRNAIVTRERKEREQRNRAPTASGVRRVAEEAFTAQDVELVVQDALAATARFFLDEIDELLPLAEALQAPAELIDSCRTARASLAAQLDARTDDETARAQLGQSEAAIAALRRGIRQAEVSQRQQDRFDAALATALRAESLALGKRHGGVINCPMAADDWPWVVQTYHHRWLPRARSIVIDGESVPLPPDQALALYVTGSSHSAYAFDVSVHLWRRRPGCDSPPAPGDALHPPMNTDDWFDTYLPCCVLHVPG